MWGENCIEAGWHIKDKHTLLVASLAAWRTGPALSLRSLKGHLMVLRRHQKACMHRCRSPGHASP